MSPGPRPHDVQFLATPTELRDWFDRNHATADELWLGYFKVSSGRAGLTWSQAKQAATRERRLTTLIDDHAAGRKPRPLTPPGER